jgi:hypothetical protein
MFSALAEAEVNGRYLKKFKEYATILLLLLDDFMLSIPSIKEVQILIELCERREFTGSTESPQLQWRVLLPSFCRLPLFA